MEIYLVLLGLVLLGFVYKAFTKLQAHLERVEIGNEQIRRQIAQLYDKLSQQAPIAEVVKKQVAETPEPEKFVKPIVVEKPIEKPVIETPPVVSETPPVEQKKEELPVEAVVEVKTESSVPLTVKTATKKTAPPSHSDANTIGNLIGKFNAKDIDYEKYIGENLVSKIGIAILVLAIGFFVKYAIDNDWIGPVGRVCIGLLSGGILIGLAHRLRKDYAAFTSVLVGGGLAVFYFTIALAYHQYHLFDQTVSFGIMVVITIFAVVLSILYDRQELAVISMVGGYATPFMVSNGSNNYIALLTYLCILNTGILVIAYMRIWRILNVLAFVFTFVIFDSWLFTLPGDTPVTTYAHGLIYASVFFTFFFIAAIANNIRENKKFLPADFSMLLANSIQYFAVGLVLLSKMNAMEYKGLFSACMAAFHLMASYLLFRRQSTDKNILFLLIGITLTFISITAPLQLDGHFITLFWASESVVLLWLYQRSGIRIISLGATIVWCVTIISLLVVWEKNYDQGYGVVTAIPIIINKAFISALYVGLCTGAIYYLRGNPLHFTEDNKQISFLFPRLVFLIAVILLLFFAGGLEVAYQFDKRFTISLSALYLTLYLLSFVLTVIYIVRRLELVALTPLLQAIIAAVLTGIFMLSLPMLFDTYHELLSQHKYIPYFAAHWVSAAIVAGLIYFMIAQLRKAENIKQAYSTLTWIIATLVIVFLSAEFYFAVFGLYYNGLASEAFIDNVFLKACLPILWGVCSFGFMWVGMRNTFRPLRIFSLVLFSVTLLKLFTYDISHVPVAGKIAAFFCLGVLLLVVSFMYQRLKKLIIQDEVHNQS